MHYVNTKLKIVVMMITSYLMHQKYLKHENSYLNRWNRL